MKRSVFIILCLEGAVLFFNVAACSAIIPSIAHSFALSQFFVARYTWVYMIPYGIAALFYGPLLRLLGARKIEFTCMLVFSGANFLAAQAANIYSLFLGRFLMGVFGASVIPLALILISKQVEKHKRGQAIGLFFASSFASSLLGLFLSGFIHWRVIFFIPAAGALFSALLVLLLLPDFKQDNSDVNFRYLSALRDKEVVRIFSYIFFISLLYHGAQHWLSVYFASALYLSQFTISSLITLTSLSGIFGEILGGRGADILGRRKTVNLGIGLMIASVFLVMIKFPLAILGVLMFVWGLGWTINHAGLSTMLIDLPERYLNEAASLNSSVRFISGGIGVALAGILMRQSFYLGFSVLGVFLVLLLAVNFRAQEA